MGVGKGGKGTIKRKNSNVHRARGSDGSLSSLGNTVPRIIYFLLDQTAPSLSGNYLHTLADGQLYSQLFPGTSRLNYGICDRGIFRS